MNTRRTTLLVAILLAVGTGWLTLNYVNSLKRSSAQSTEQRPVVVAVADIPARTTITPAMLARTTRPASAVEPDAIADPAVAAGQLSLITIPAGAEITSSKVGRPGSVGLPVQLSPGKRAVSIQVDKVKGISGLIQPGDRVDIIAIPPRQNNEPPAAVTILRGIKVLAVGTTLETASATPSPDEQSSTTVTIEVTPQQADLVDMADANTNLRLSLRSPKEPLNSEPTEALHFAMPSAPVQVAAHQPAPAFAPAKADPPSRPQHIGIMIIDGDHIGYSGDPQ